MKILETLILLVCVLTLGACDGGDGGGIAATPEQKVAKVYVSVMQKMADAIEGIHDEASAKKAAEIIKQANAQIESMAEKYDGKLGGIAGTAAFSNHQDELMAIQARIATSMSRLAMSKPELMQIVSKEMQNGPKW